MIHDVAPFVLHPVLIGIFSDTVWGEPDKLLKEVGEMALI